MLARDTTARKYRVGDWYFETGLHRLECGDKQVRLEPRVAQLLLYLVTHPGQPVSRDTLMDAIWPDSVVGDEALNNAVNKLRRAFEDDSQSPRIVETLPKIGYRLIAPVSPAGDEKQPRTASSSGATPAGPAGRSLLWTALVAGLALVAAGVWLTVFGDRPVATPPSGAIDSFTEQSIAVLPFENLNHDPAQDYFADGMSDDLITELSKVPGLLVISRSSSYAFRNQPSDIREIAKVLDARFIVEGSVRRENDTIRINAQLVDAASGHQLWAERFDGSSNDVFELQDQITQQVVLALESRLPGSGLIVNPARPTADLNAYELFLQGSGIFQRFSRADTFDSRNYFEQALSRDPNFSSAYAMLAWTYVFEYTNGWSQEPQTTLERALELARRSIATDSRSSIAHFVKGLVHRERKEFDLALAEARRALEIEPSYANGYVLMATLAYYDGRPQQGLEMLELASRLNPLHPSNYPFHKGQALFILQRYDEAVDAFLSGLEQNPTSQRLRVWLAATYAQQGLIDEARWEAGEILSTDPEFSPADLETIFPFRNSADLERFNAALRKAGFTSLASH